MATIDRFSPIGPTVLVMLQHQVHTLISCCCYQNPRDGHVCQVCARDDKEGKDKLIHYDPMISLDIDGMTLTFA